MQIFIFGGSGSGKSAFAEGLAQELAGKDTCYYLATMMPEGTDAQRRIERHKAMRAHRGFVALEQYTGLHELKILPHSTVLLECLGTLVANEIFSIDDALHSASDRIWKDISHLQQQAEHLIIVSNNVGADGVQYAQETEYYRRILADCNLRLCAQSTHVVELVCGIPLFVKGGEPCVSYAL